MNRKRKCIFLAVGVASALLGLVPAPSGGGTRGKGAAHPPLAMEELEVRGFRVKPEALYLPVSKPVASYAPVRFDLFAEDLTGPIRPFEITNDKVPIGGIRDYGKSVD